MFYLMVIVIIQQIQLVFETPCSHLKGANNFQENFFCWKTKKIQDIKQEHEVASMNYF